MVHSSKPAAFDRAALAEALIEAFRKLDPRQLMRNPVIFVTEIGAALVTGLWLRDLWQGTGQPWFSGQITAWLWFTVLFATFAEALAEGRGKAQAASLRQSRCDVRAHRLVLPDSPDPIWENVSALDLEPGDVVLVAAGEIIPLDGEIVAGVAAINEAAITGESAPVIREAGGDRSAVTGGTTVLSDEIRISITAAPGETFIDRMIALVEGAKRQRTPNELALSVLLSGMTLIFLIAVVTLWGLAGYSGTAVSVVVLVALLVTLIPTTIGGLLSAIGIAGMDRLIRFNVLATSGRAVEAAGDVDTLLLDKTGTITFGNRMASEFVPMPGVSERRLAEAALLSSRGDETPEGRSVVALAQADVGVAMQTGTQAAREAGNMVDLDSNPTKLIEIVGIGKQLLMTRGALTTFSISNDVAKYFAILPALFVATYPQMGALNLMQLGSPQSAILSAVIFNALIIVALIPLALRGVRYRPVAAAGLLRRNLAIYGLGGLVMPFACIKLIDLALTHLNLA